MNANIRRCIPRNPPPTDLYSRGVRVGAFATGPIRVRTSYTTQIEKRCTRMSRIMSRALSLAVISAAAQDVSFSASFADTCMFSSQLLLSRRLTTAVAECGCLTELWTEAAAIVVLAVSVQTRIGIDGMKVRRHRAATAVINVRSSREACGVHATASGTRSCSGTSRSAVQALLPWIALG